MQRLRIVLTILLLACVSCFSCFAASAATTYSYQNNEVKPPVWDGTNANTNNAPTADYAYTYGDEATVVYNLPWALTFYGQSYNSITADTNGNVWFTASGPANSFNLTTNTTGPVIAAWNTDLSSDFYGGVFIQHKTNPERIVIEWQAETYFDEAGNLLNDFEVVLYPNNTIRLDYNYFNSAEPQDFGSGLSLGNGATSISLSSLYGNAYTLAGRSFQFSPAGNISLSTQAVDFGYVFPGTKTQPYTITATNSGTNNLVMSQVSLTNDNNTYAIVTGSDTCSGATLAPLQSCTIQTSFNPTDLMQRNGTLTFNSNAVMNPALTVTLVGNSGAASPLIFSNQGTAGSPVSVAAARYSTITLNNSYVVFSGQFSAYSISLTNGSVITQNQTGSLQIYATNNVSIDATSKIDVSGKGYPGANQEGNSSGTGMTYGNTTTGGSGYYAGGSYAGLGGSNSSQYPSNASYGNMLQPGELGSGGGNSGSSAYPGGNGGGLVVLTTPGTLSLNGSILANGQTVSNTYYSAGGSGGGILLNVGTLSGAGTISANGGSVLNSTYPGSGGGGRIAVYYTMNTLPVANISATGGQSGDGSVTERNGGAGTIFLKNSANSGGDVIVSNGGIATTTTTTIPGGNYNSFTATGGAILAVTGNTPALASMTISNNMSLASGSVSVGGAVNVTGALSLQNGSVLSHLGATTTVTYSLNVTAASVSIDATSKIDVSGKGYLGAYQGGNNSSTGMTYGNTTTGGSGYYAGGSYAGLGGSNSSQYPSNASYGNMLQPGELGSGGGNSGSSAYPGGNGGGLIVLTTPGILSLNGSILANGEPGTNDYRSAGGSGGGILLNVGTLSGAGTISANGGSVPNSTYTGSGGGGRIAVYYTTNTLPVANIIATGGMSGNGSVAASNGGAGTIYLKNSANSYGDVIVSNGGIATTTTPVPDYNLTANLSGSGTGTVVSLPAGINCGTTCNSQFAETSSVTLTAVPNPGYTFVGWSGACSGTGNCTLTMSGNTTVTATFILPPATANFTFSPQLAGAPVLVTFTDQSQYATSWSWNFGDGTTSTLENPTHLYRTAGSYTVSQTATNASGSSTVTQTVTASTCATNAQVMVGNTYYTTLQAAYNAAPDGSTILAQAISFTENLTTNAAKSVTFDGGYLCGFASNPDMTTIIGAPQISNGIVTMKNFQISD